MKFLFFTFFIFGRYAMAANLDEIVKKAENNLRGKSFQGKIKMTIVRPDVERVLVMKVWLEGLDLATIKILQPAKEKGVANLRRQTDLWQYLPKVDRMVRIPSSMMLQNWMGSDFSNDDMVKSSSLVRDYKHKLVKKEGAGKNTVWLIESTPKPSLPVAWKKINLYVREGDAATLKREFISEKNEVVKILVGKKFKTFGDKTFPTLLEMTNPKKPGTKTTIEYSDVVFDAQISEETFTQLFLKRAAD
ncbi:MAG: outer membrane lipoprotein-sorting protein [Bdellovibrionales bacterium]|nr:outer membrane lipoprotein-sorting protein [Bdellovibrionales bacterium]